MIQYAALNPRTLLYAEDDEASRWSTSLLLKHLGYRLILAKDGRDALEKYLSNRREIGLLLLDMMMPGMNGVEVLNQIRMIDPGIKAMIYTANPDAVHAALEGRTAGVRVLTKPAGVEQLAGMLESMLGVDECDTETGRGVPVANS